MATIVLVRQHPGLGARLAVAGGVALALGVVLVVLRFAAACRRWLRPTAIDFVTRITGLLLTAIAVQLVVGAVAHWRHRGLG